MKLALREVELDALAEWDGYASIGPPVLRSLDALHLATALSIRDEIGAFLTYDKNLAGIARENGLSVLSPDLTS